MDQLIQVLQSGQTAALSPTGIMLNITLAFLLSVVLALIYRRTHTGLSYSQSFTLTLVFVSIIISIVMMVIGASLVRAFALLGALSMIRFRTVVKDTKDTAFIFGALAIGMGCGTGAHNIALLATLSISVVAYILFKINFGVAHKIDYLLRFTFEQGQDSAQYTEAIRNLTKASNILHIEPSGDNKYLTLTYTLKLKRSVGPDQLIREVSRIPGVSELTMENVRHDIHY